MNRKILFLSASIGLGHIKAAQAIIDELRKKNSHIEIRHIDVLSLMPVFLYKPLLDLYLWSLPVSPQLYGLLYSWGDTGGGRGRRLFYWLLALRLKKVLADFSPECVVCTHSLAAGMLDSWNRNFAILPYICCVTDFVIHASWIYPSAAAYIIDNKQQLGKLSEYGITAERCRQWGIPFSKPRYISKSDSRRLLKLADNKKVIFIFGGGCGVISLDVRKLLPLDINRQLVICCGLNRKLYDELQRDDEVVRHCRVLGYIDNIDLWLTAADIIITKAGGLSLCEVLAAGRHCIIYRPLAGQEARNAAYCRSQQWVEIAENEMDCKKIIDKIFRIESNENRGPSTVGSLNTESAMRIADWLDNKLYK